MEINYTYLVAMNQEYRNYLQSKEWAQIKIDIYSARGRKCERCASKKKLQVHHKTYDNIFHEEPKDLEILCELCHSKEHRKKVKVKKRKFKLKKKNGKKPQKLSGRDRYFQDRYNKLRREGKIK